MNGTMTQAPKFRLMVTGPRDFPSYFRVYCVVAPILIAAFNDSYDPVLVGGGASGVDSFADLAASRLGFSTERFPANWKRYKKRAGFVRNDQMLDTRPDLVVAIGYGSGTAHAINGAQERGLRLLLKSQWWIGASAR